MKKLILLLLFTSNAIAAQITPSSMEALEQQVTQIDLMHQRKCNDLPMLTVKNSGGWTCVSRMVQIYETVLFKDIFGNIKETKIEKNCAVILQCMGVRK